MLSSVFQSFLVFILLFLMTVNLQLQPAKIHPKLYQFFTDHKLVGMTAGTDQALYWHCQILVIKGLGNGGKESCNNIVNKKYFIQSKMFNKCPIFSHLYFYIFSILPRHPPTSSINLIVLLEIQDGGLQTRAFQYLARCVMQKVQIPGWPKPYFKTSFQLLQVSRPPMSSSDRDSTFT